MTPDKKQWVQEHLDSTSYLFFQGRDSSQLQAIRYLGNNKITATTGEEAQISVPNILTIPQQRIWLYPEIKEIDRKDQWSLGSLISKFKFWFMGISVTKNNKNTALPLYPTDEMGSVYQYSVINQKRSLGQDNDISDHKNKVDALEQYAPKINKVLYGVSRGAATTFAALSQHHYHNVKLCVLEGPPGSISAQIKFYFTKFLGRLLYNDYLAPWIIGGAHKADKNKQAKAQIDNFPDDVPLVIISSRNDWTVQHKSSFNLALGVAAKRIKAKDNGEDVAPVYFLQLDDSGHNQYFRTDVSNDAIRYQHFIHALYKKHGLPYIEDYAALGAAELDTADLTYGLLKEQTKYHGLFKSTQENRKGLREEAFVKLKSDLDLMEDVNKKDRIINMCSAMSLFSKPIDPGYLYAGETKLQELKELTANIL